MPGALKNGYLSAFPVEFFDRLRDREKVWAPFYTIHKIMAGLLDMYVYTGNEQALDMVEKMAAWTDRLHRLAQLRAHAARARHGIRRHGRDALQICTQ